MGSEMVMLPEPVKEVAATLAVLLMVTSKLLGAVTVTLPLFKYFCKSKALMLDLLVKFNVPELSKLLSAEIAPFPLKVKVPAVIVVEPV